MIENQEENFLKSIEENVKTAAKAKGFNISDLATAVDMTATGFYRMLETGSYKVITLKRISDVLGVSVSELLGEIPDDSEKKVFRLLKEVAKELNSQK